MPQIVANSDFGSSTDTAGSPGHDHRRPQCTPSIDSSPINTGKLSSPIEQDTQHHSHGKLSPQQACNPASLEEAEETLGVIHKDCASAMGSKQDGCIVEVECSSEKQLKQDVACDMACGEQQEVVCSRISVDDATKSLSVPRDVNVCTFEMEKLSVNDATDAYDGREGQALAMNEGIKNVLQTERSESNGDILELPMGKEREQQSPISPPPRRTAARHASEPSSRRTPVPMARHTPEPTPRVLSEPEFVMEDSSWPTLAEARHVKPSEARSSPSHKETAVSVSSPARKVPSSQVKNLQEASMEASRHSRTNPPHQQGPRYRSSYTKNNGSGYNKPSFPPTENNLVPPMGVHVPSANMFHHADRSRKQNGISGANNFLPVPHHAAANGSYYHNRGGLVPFPQNSLPPYGRGHPGWQHGRGYHDVNYKHSGYVPVYDQQHFGPRPVHHPSSMGPFMNISMTQHNYPNYPTNDMYYMPVPAGYGYAPPYFGPSGPSGAAMQGFDLQTLLMQLQRQIEYYFSKENLSRDFFLTSKMDEEGFVPVSLIASFPRVRSLTSDTTFIFEALKNSSIVELKNGKLRSREWRRRLSGPSQTTGVESVQSFAPSLSKSGVDLPRNQGPVESVEIPRL